jgi:hypothetical protein
VISRLEAFLAGKSPFVSCMVEAGILAIAACFFLIIYLAIAPRPVYDSSAHATAWIDSNADGYWSTDEEPLAAVCFFVLPSKQQPETEYVAQRCAKASEAWRTDSTGQWPHAHEPNGATNFFAGSKCSDLWIVAVPPPGYISTTPSAVHDCEASFGFREVDS